MNNNPIILTSTGYGTSGSSAGTNILEEYSSVTSFGNGFECTFLHELDGLYDLEKALSEGHRLKTDLAIKRFLKLSYNLNKDNDYKKYFNNDFYKYAEEYIDSIVDAKWNGWWHRAFEVHGASFVEKTRIKVAEAIYHSLYANKVFNSYEPDNWQPSYTPLIECYYSNKKNNFYDKTKLYMEKLFFNEAIQTPYILVDQLLPAYNIDAYSKYFSNIKTLVIDRDPRNIYAVNKAESGDSYIPTANIDMFIEWYKATRFEQNRINIDHKECALFLKFEELIYEYDGSIKKIERFTGLSENEHIYKKKYFNPEKSIVNTQIYKRYPRLKSDIEKIEKELSEFCFPFEKYKPEPVKIFSDDYIFIEDIKKTAENYQLQGILPKQAPVKFILLALNSTTLFFVLKNMKKRKTKKSKLKGFIKICMFLPTFIFEFFFYILFLVFSKKG